MAGGQYISGALPLSSRWFLISVPKVLDAGCIVLLFYHMDGCYWVGLNVVRWDGCYYRIVRSLTARRLDCMLGIGCGSFGFLAWGCAGVWSGYFSGLLVGVSCWVCYVLG
ncbi:hypothetical protein F4861DRAFT_493908 [Xylaria intraflava]|nr:hypothetical protein F4861DRAFT_493908 [Xylaria intraflava]